MSQGALAEADPRPRSVGQVDVCAVVVTHHPRLETVRSLDALAPQVRELLIVDNGSSAEELAPIDAAALRLGARVVRFGYDMGTGAAFNFALESARTQGFKWLATFDQDSRASAAMLGRMLRLLNAYPDREQVAIVAPVQADDSPPGPPAPPAAAPKAATVTTPPQGMVDPTAPAAPPAPTAIPPAPPARWRQLPSATASGALLNVAAASRVGGFDARLFVDYLDHDFCLRLRKQGFHIIEASEVRMLPPASRIEIPLAGKPEPTEPLSPVRRYYVTRNRMLLWRRYLRFDRRWVMADIRGFFRETGSMILWEKEIPRKLWMMLRGFLDALRNRRGELEGYPR